MPRDHFQKFLRVMWHIMWHHSQKKFLWKILRSYNSIERNWAFFKKTVITEKEIDFELFQVKVSLDSGGNKMRLKCFFFFFFYGKCLQITFSIVFFSWPFLKMCHEIFNLLIVKLSAFTISIFFLFTPVFSHYLEKV